VGQGQICLPRPSATASLSGRRQGKNIGESCPSFSICLSKSIRLQTCAFYFCHHLLLLADRVARCKCHLIFFSESKFFPLQICVCFTFLEFIYAFAWCLPWIEIEQNCQCATHAKIKAVSKSQNSLFSSSNLVCKRGRLAAEVKRASLKPDAFWRADREPWARFTKFLSLIIFCPFIQLKDCRKICGFIEISFETAMQLLERWKYFSC
jgi:hypothetical protein